MPNRTPQHEVTNEQLLSRIERLEHGLFDSNQRSRIENIERALFSDRGENRLEEIYALLNASKAAARVIGWLAALTVPVISIIVYLKGKV